MTPITTTVILFSLPIDINTTPRKAIIEPAQANFENFSFKKSIASSAEKIGVVETSKLAIPAFT